MIEETEADTVDLQAKRLEANIAVAKRNRAIAIAAAIIGVLVGIALLSMVYVVHLSSDREDVTEERYNELKVDFAKVKSELDEFNKAQAIEDTENEETEDCSATLIDYVAEANSTAFADFAAVGALLGDDAEAQDADKLLATLQASANRFQEAVALRTAWNAGGRPLPCPVGSTP